jgi:peptidoglycan hydrolase-like protein with peptidoglycan-binding domain
MATTAGGIGVLVVVGLMAVGYSEAGWGSTGTAAQAGDVDEGTATCDGVLVVETGTDSVSVPGDVIRADGDPSTACRIPMDQGDEAAVTAVQQALVSCHGQSVTVDGSYGPETAAAVTAVQQQGGVAPDGEYGPATMGVMRWPVDGTGHCVESGATGAASSGAATLPATG